MTASPQQAAPEPTLRILHVSEVHWGGVVTLLRHFTAEQLTAGHEVHLLSPALSAPLAGVVQHEWSVARTRPQSYAAAVRALRRTVAELQPDVIHLHSFVAGFLGRLPFGLSGTADVPVVYQPHAWSTDLYESKAASRAIAEAERSGARHTDVLVANCWDEVEAGRRFGVDLPSHELGVTVDLAMFHPVSPAERRRVRADLGLGEEPVLLVLGRLARQKGQDLLVPAWEAAPVPGAVLALVGPGETEPLQALAPRSWGQTIRAVGEPPAVLPWLWAADLLLLPSRYETVGLVVAEALATGLPVVASEVDGARATIQDPDTLGSAGLEPAGTVVAQGDMGALLREAARRLADRELCDREARAARERAEQLFRPESVAQRLEAAYRDARIRSQSQTQEMSQP